MNSYEMLEHSNLTLRTIDFNIVAYFTTRCEGEYQLVTSQVEVVTQMCDG